MRIARLAVSAVLAFTIGTYYLWCARATGHNFDWHHDLGGYYNYLARGFAKGHLYVDIEPSPQLLALPNPYAAGIDDSIKMHDMAFYRGHYYLYHGVTPAILLFTPWRLLTGHDMPENFALALFCCGGFLFSAGALYRLLALAKAEPSPLLLGAMLLAIGICQSVPYLLNRIWVYEIAIGGGYFCLSGAVFCLLSSLRSARPSWWLAASGLLFGCAIGCRPHLGLAAVVATIIVLRERKGAIFFLIPLTLTGLAVAFYNYQRFGNPFEFGIHYLMGSHPDLNRTELVARYVRPGLYYFLVCPPDFSPVFPWIRLMFRYSWDIPKYFVEPMCGVIFLAPFLVGLLLVPVARGIRFILMLLLITSSLILLFVCGTGFTTQRYDVDFLPLAVLAVCAAVAVVVARATGWRRSTLTALFVLLVIPGVIVNLAIGIAGPYNDVLKNRTKTYFRIADRLSPIERYRPVLNPPIDISFTAMPRAQKEGFREPLLSLGHQTWRDILVLEHHPVKCRLISQSDTTSAEQEIDNPAGRRLHFHVQFQPQTRELTVFMDGEPVLKHALPALVTAPSQVTIGENRIDLDACARRFTGRIE